MTINGGESPPPFKGIKMKSTEKLLVGIIIAQAVIVIALTGICISLVAS